MNWFGPYEDTMELLWSCLVLLAGPQSLGIITLPSDERLGIVCEVTMAMCV